MAIKGWAETLRVPRIGKLHLGVKKQSDRNGSEYPSAVDFFVCKADESTSEAAAVAFHLEYGDKPKEIRIAFPSDNPEQFFPQSLSSYRTVGGKRELFCKGDGETASRSSGQGGYLPLTCQYKECSIYAEGKCREMIDTGSVHSVININSSIALLRGLTGGKIKMIPLTKDLTAIHQAYRHTPTTVNPYITRTNSIPYA